MTLGARRPARRPVLGWPGLRGSCAPAAGTPGRAADVAIPTMTRSSRSRRWRAATPSWFRSRPPRAVTPAVEQAIASGLPTTFTYDVELRRPSMFWFDKLVDSARIAATVRFDPLTRRYHVTLLQDGRVAEERTTDHVDEVRRWVSVFDGCRCSPPASCEEHTDYDVRVRGRTSPRHTWSFWPWARPRRTAAPASPSCHDPADACDGSPLAGRCGTTRS